RFSGISLMKAVSTLWNGSTNIVDYPYQLGLLATMRASSRAGSWVDGPEQLQCSRSILSVARRKVMSPEIPVQGEGA
ncbi:hypothetical protein, partial [Cryobacterium melibiosiphilum]|uniref:hypothetical protein n=1 Tax=Cryobacterium melibiosiphilum TaxID=995039 RepID=UPI001F32B442